MLGRRVVTSGRCNSYKISSEEKDNVVNRSAAFANSTCGAHVAAFHFGGIYLRARDKAHSPFEGALRSCRQNAIKQYLKLGAVAGPPHFECGAFDHSATSPARCGKRAVHSHSYGGMLIRLAKR